MTALTVVFTISISLVIITLLLGVAVCSRISCSLFPDGHWMVRYFLPIGSRTFRVYASSWDIPYGEHCELASLRFAKVLHIGNVTILLTM